MTKKPQKVMVLNNYYKRKEVLENSRNLILMAYIGYECDMQFTWNNIKIIESVDILIILIVYFLGLMPSKSAMRTCHVLRLCLYQVTSPAHSLGCE